MKKKEMKNRKWRIGNEEIGNEKFSINNLALTIVWESKEADKLSRTATGLLKSLREERAWKDGKETDRDFSCW